MQPRMTCRLLPITHTQKLKLYMYTRARTHTQAMRGKLFLATLDPLPHMSSSRDCLMLLQSLSFSEMYSLVVLIAEYFFFPYYSFSLKKKYLPRFVLHIFSETLGCIFPFTKYK